MITGPRKTVAAAGPGPGRVARPSRCTITRTYESLGSPSTVKPEPGSTGRARVSFLVRVIATREELGRKRQRTRKEGMCYRTFTGDPAAGLRSSRAPGEAFRTSAELDPS
eukprot:768354-Hanusia_phi.AAC.2